MEKLEKAKRMFETSHNCAQSVASQYAAETGLDEDVLCRAACAFGAGGGRKQLTCGAVSGALLALSLIKGRGAGGVKTDQETSYALARELIDRFEAEFGSSQCRALVDGADLLTPEGQTRFREERIGERCSTYVAGSVRILEEILARA